MNVCDWRDAPAEVVAPLYSSARQRWLQSLGWETSATWERIEDARIRWGLPGLLAVDDAGAVQGWTFFLAQDDVLQVGGLTAATPLVTRALIESLIQVGGDAGARGVSCFMFEDAPAVGAELARSGFSTEPFIYLVRDLAACSAPAAPGSRSWRAADIGAAAVLLRAAYDADAAEHLAPGHTMRAWRRYVTNLVEQTGLGALDGNASRIVTGRGGRVDALAMVTSLSPDTAHIAQVAVHPSRRGAGLAAALVDDACTRAARGGHSRVSLLVGSSNTAARRLYARLGFSEGPKFLAGRRLSIP